LAVHVEPFEVRPLTRTMRMLAWRFGPCLDDTAMSPDVSDAHPNVRERASIVRSAQGAIDGMRGRSLEQSIAGSVPPDLDHSQKLALPIRQR